MKIAITTNTLNAGGAEMQRVILANGLAQRGHQVMLVCLQRTGPLAQLLSAGVRVVVQGWRQPLVGMDAVVTGTTNTEMAFAWLSRLKSRTTRWVVVFHNPVGPGAPRLKHFASLMTRHADIRAALTSHQAAFIETHWRHAIDCLLPNGVDVHALKSQLEDVPSPSSRFTYGFLGRMSTKHKGLDLMLEAFARYAPKDSTLALAGQGPDVGSLMAVADHLGISPRLSWLGHQPSAQFLSRIDCLLLFSRYEAQPMVVLEAQAMGVPILGSRFAGVATAGGNVVVSPGLSANDYEAAFAHKLTPTPCYASRVLTAQEMVLNYEQVLCQLTAGRREH